MLEKLIRDLKENEGLRDWYLFLNSYGIGFMSKAYEGPGMQFIHNYAADTCATMGHYFLFRLFNINKKSAALGAIFGPSMQEVLQGMGKCRGTYDPKDFLAFAVGLGIAYTGERMINKWAKNENKLKKVAEI